MTGFLLDTNVPSELTRPKSEPRVEKWMEELVGPGAFRESPIAAGQAGADRSSATHVGSNTFKIA